jgi:hypothetical protein
LRQIGGYPGCRLIAVNSRIQAQLLALGFPAAQTAVIPAFLPSEDPIRVEDLPEGIRAFGTRCRPLLSVYGIHCELQPRWGDLYGFDLSLHALNIVRQRHPDAGLVVLTPNNRSKPYFHQLAQRARELGVENAVWWETDSMPDATPLWKFSDVYLRPTTTDGDALAVREALSVGTPVVASDVGERPQGCRVFPSGNLTAFVAAIEMAIEQRHLQRPCSDLSGFEAVMRVYAELWPALVRQEKKAHE